MRIGVVVLQLGTPDAPTPQALRPYLKQFLSDPRVLDMPAFFRWLLVNVVILPTRPKQSAKAYASIWTKEGSPLAVISRRFTAALQAELGVGRFDVRLAMSYGSPSTPEVLRSMVDQGYSRIILLPMYPQYASATTGGTLAGIFETLKDFTNVPAIQVVPPFFQDPGFIETLVDNTANVVARLKPDRILFSYHGLPEKQILKSASADHTCLKRDDSCCSHLTDKNSFCYRAQCFATSRALVEGLRKKMGDSIPSTQTSFQSRLGRTPWIKPYTDEVLHSLPSQGVKRLAVVSPAFTADCLETLEELGDRGKHGFLEAGGEAFELVPAVNDSSRFVQAAAGWVRNLAK
jgi:protoporphyrin/coproporphyrin ferrochelatase